jgi:hypothetical protein
VVRWGSPFDSIIRLSFCCQRRIGGLGIHPVPQIVDSLAHERREGKTAYS